MEILGAVEIMTLSWSFGIGFILLFIGIICIIIGGTIENPILFGIGIILGLACIVIFLFTPGSMPLGKMEYTVEITDAAKYKELVDAGYEFTKLFDTREIYKIVGDVIK